MRSFPFDRCRVRVLTVEHNYGPHREPIRAYFDECGYERVAMLDIDNGYVHREELGPASRSYALSGASTRLTRAARGAR
jgi:hypothetical protein